MLPSTSPIYSHANIVFAYSGGREAVYVARLKQLECENAKYEDELLQVYNGCATDVTLTHTVGAHNNNHYTPLKITPRSNPNSDRERERGKRKD